VCGVTISQLPLQEAYQLGVERILWNWVLQKLTFETDQVNPKLMDRLNQNWYVFNWTKRRRHVHLFNKNAYCYYNIKSKIGSCLDTQSLQLDWQVFLWLGLPSTQHEINMRMELIISMVRPTIYKNSSLKLLHFKFAITGFLFSSRRSEIILKIELSEKDSSTIITWFHWPSFPQTQIQNDWWLLHF